MSKFHFLGDMTHGGSGTRKMITFAANIEIYLQNQSSLFKLSNGGFLAGWHTFSVTKRFVVKFSGVGLPGHS